MGSGLERGPASLGPLLILLSRRATTADSPYQFAMLVNRHGPLGRQHAPPRVAHGHASLDMKFFRLGYSGLHHPMCLGQGQCHVMTSWVRLTGCRVTPQLDFVPFQVPQFELLAITLRPPRRTDFVLDLHALGLQFRVELVHVRRPKHVAML